MLHDIITYLKDRNDNPKTTQSIISIKNIFRGYIIIDWFDTSNTIKYRIANKIIVKACILFYNICWAQWNKITYSKEKKHEFLIKWYRKSKEYGESRGGEVLKFIKAYKIDEKKIKIE